jgi:hypothetical protein
MTGPFLILFADHLSACADTRFRVSGLFAREDVVIQTPPLDRKPIQAYFPIMMLNATKALDLLLTNPGS